MLAAEQLSKQLESLELLSHCPQKSEEDCVSSLHLIPEFSRSKNILGKEITDHSAISGSHRDGGTAAADQTRTDGRAVKA